MHYVISDIHNDSLKFSEMLRKIRFTNNDQLYILGDLFDRSNKNPDPLDVYFNVLKLGDACTVIRENHDQWLAMYILEYYGLPERKRKKKEPYPYNSFQILQERLTPVDMQSLAEYILALPLQCVVEVNDQKYLLAHAMTSMPEVQYEENYYLMGSSREKIFLDRGISGYTSICGHRNAENNHIWKNRKGNVYLCDCGCGFSSGKLGCLCLETKEEFYV